MKQRNKFSLLTILVFPLILIATLPGCMPLKIRRTSTGQPLSKYYSFSKEQFRFNSEYLDTSVIYVNGQEWLRTYIGGVKDALFPQNARIEKTFEYEFIKFGSNGIAFLSSSSKDSINGINIYTLDGQFCYYKVVNNELQLEFFDFRARKFVIWYGQITGAKIQFYKDRLRVWGGGKSKLNLIYEKKTIRYNRVLIWPD